MRPRQDKENAMRIIVNGRERDLLPNQTLHQFIVSMHLDPDVVVTELNGVIVPGTAFTETILRDGDRLELLSFVGGG